MVGTVAEDYVKSLLAGGEVLLIETRQHWMAAIRYALKPIVLIGAVILLALLNQWLHFDGFLNFINVLVNFALVIMIIAAIIWLPINLVQWYSRRYVLTNRRVIRLSGVVRKETFDSSLEKINDIAMHQSVFGRTLGYADLTLYTASDSANEAYSQLLDGLQFKKAALDAKEALRNGVPLSALPEGFVVKGGLNEASLRADGKIKDPVPAAKGVGGSDSDGAADESAEAIAPVPAHATPLPEPVPPVTAEPLAEPALVVEPEAEAEASDEAVAEPKPEPAPDAAAEPQADPAWPEADSASGPDGGDDDEQAEGDPDKPA